MTTDFRALVARMADELDYYRQLLMDDRREVHALAVEARAALAEPQPPTDGSMMPTEQQVQVRRILGLGWEPGDGTEDGAQLIDGDWWFPALGCDSLQETVLRVRHLLSAKSQPPADLLEQLAATGKPGLQVEPTDEELNELFVQFDPTGQAECSRGYARAVLTRWGSLAPQPIAVAAVTKESLTTEPIPVAERLPEAGDCDDSRCWQWLLGRWELQHRDWLSDFDGEATHWLPAHALPVPRQEPSA